MAKVLMSAAAGHAVDVRIDTGTKWLGFRLRAVDVAEMAFKLTAVATPASGAVRTLTAMLPVGAGARERLWMTARPGGVTAMRVETPTHFLRFELTKQEAAELIGKLALLSASAFAEPVTYAAVESG